MSEPFWPAPAAGRTCTRGRHRPLERERDSGWHRPLERVRNLEWHRPLGEHALVAGSGHRGEYVILGGTRALGEHALVAGIGCGCEYVILGGIGLRARVPNSVTNRAQRCEIHKPAVFGGWEGRGLACESRTYAILVKTISRAILKS